MKYLLLSNTHNGQGSVIVKFTAVRVVCQNTLMLSLDDGQPTLRVRHSKMMKDRLQEAAVVIAAASQVYEKTGELFRAMAAYQLTCDAAEQYFSGIFPPTPPQKKKDARPPRVGHLLRILDSQPDLQMDGVRGTLWGAYNAVTRFEDYKERDDETSGDRLNRVWFGSGAEIKLNALKHARTLLGSI